jgi:hypothetical protein
MAVSMIIYHNSDNFQEGSMLVGYASMILAFSLIFVGIKNYRDKHNNGAISFGQAFKIGLFITLIASTFYVVTWMIEYHYFIPDFMEKYTAVTLEGLKKEGASQAEITEKTKEMAQYTEMYKNPVMVFFFTYLEVLPVGLLVTLICALLLKRKTASLV